MWIVFAFGSAVFAGLTSILAKCGVRETDSTVATAIRTIVVLAFSWLMVFLTGSQTQIASIDAKTLLFLILSGLATGASWLCYFKALQVGDINKVVPVDKSSTVLTILLAFLFLRREHHRLQRSRCFPDRRRNFSDDREKGCSEACGTGKRMVPLRGRLRRIRQSDVYSRQDRYLRCGVESGNGRPHRRSADHVVAHGVCDRKTKGIKTG